MKSAIVFLCLLGAASAATLLSVRRGPDDDHFVDELHDNADYKNATHKPQDNLQKDFVALDLNSDRKLNENELMFHQYATGCEPIEAQVRARDYMRCGDLNKDKWIDLQEYTEAAKKPEFTECVSDSDLRRAHGFVKFFDADQNYDDKLSKQELVVGMIELWGQPGVTLADDLMKCADKDKDGFMNQAEFHDSICAYNPMSRTWQMWKGTSDTGILKCMAPAFKMFDAALVFDATDKNHDHKISPQESYATINAVSASKMQQTTADAIFKAADTDKDGFLNLDEFAKAGEAYKGDAESGFFLGGHAKWPTDTYNEGYGMSVSCYSRERGQWRVFSDELGRVTVEPKKPWTGNVTVKQR